MDQVFFLVLLFMRKIFTWYDIDNIIRYINQYRFFEGQKCRRRIVNVGIWPRPTFPMICGNMCEYTFEWNSRRQHMN
ncbi:hypothetical protein DERF_005343 [Dermatophagoides farinae]|uniref:Uncharacterized protein n=1 Tax=Dermatophagoides farinae TaxID=6954 RepID=A0A922L633_DERFA|nr:hypothetical protein DERF_005343 [Dermatophagoides farinae]